MIATMSKRSMFFKYKRNVLIYNEQAAGNRLARHTCNGHDRLLNFLTIEHFFVCKVIYEQNASNIDFIAIVLHGVRQA